MCGFVGFTGKVEEQSIVLGDMMDQIIHRGPDSAGQYLDEQIAIGFRRLSIIDLEGGNQPLYNEDGTIVLVFNGEIYNYKALREELVLLGHHFKTASDSEVLIHGYESFGPEWVKRLRGMFSFVIWDVKKKRLMGFRDYFGIKPFYYYHKDGCFLFGSEIKSFLQHPKFQKVLNEAALEHYLSFQYCPLEETFFKDVFKLPPAHFLVLEDGKLTVTRYWEPVFDSVGKSFEKYVEEIDEVFKTSVEAHMVSDVEVGCFLSSGVDSSYVASCFHGDKTFTVGFSDIGYNEIDYAKSLSEYILIDNYNQVISKDAFFEALPKVQYHMDEPLADPAAVALYFVARLASQHVKVVLSGEGADELFGGYNIYREPIDLALYRKLPRALRLCLGKCAQYLPNIRGKSFLIRGSQSIEERFIGNANLFSVKQRKKVLKHRIPTKTPQRITKPFYEKVQGKDDITKMQYLDIHLWLPGDILLKADKMSMAHSIELRVPFLDKEMMKLAGKLPTNYRVNDQYTKYAMRMAAYRNIPMKVAGKKKLGFPVPIRIWLREETYYRLVKKAFLSETASEFFNTKILMRLLNRHYQGKGDYSRKIWAIYCFLIWHREFFGH